ncbi:hypothetical protein, partial [Atlantibacter hermannii]|uniref:hypothetical protein n=1 Tax=Atlantibacter hermannii TaxID=565 RepID=UPI0028AEFE73
LQMTNMISYQGLVRTFLKENPFQAFIFRFLRQNNEWLNIVFSNTFCIEDKNHSHYHTSPSRGFLFCK